MAGSRGTFSLQDGKGYDIAHKSVFKDLEHSRVRFYVYIMASFSGALYVGLTTNIERRAWEHRNKRSDGFTARYNINRLVYYERYDFLVDAFSRERQIKKWRRSKKAALIERGNPDWNDLAMSDEEFERVYLQW